MVQDAELGKRLADKLVEVSLHGGEARWVYVHTEVHGRYETGFPERLFTYNYRTFDR